MFSKLIQISILSLYLVILPPTLPNTHISSSDKFRLDLKFISSLQGQEQDKCFDVRIVPPSVHDGKISFVTILVNTKAAPIYEWSVTRGIIESGQGTPRITVNPKADKGTYTATVRVTAGDCSSTASASIDIGIISIPTRDMTVILGTVKEFHGDVLKGVTVLAKKVRSRFTASDNSNSDGEYKLRPVEAGRYRVTASLDGYQSSTKLITLSDGDQKIIDFELQKTKRK